MTVSAPAVETPVAPSPAERRSERSATLLAAGAGALAALVALAPALGTAFPALLFLLVAALAVAGLARPFVALVAAVLSTSTFGWVVVGPDVSSFQLLVAAAALGVAVAERRELPALARRIARTPAFVAAAAFVAWVALAAAVRGGGDLGFVRNYAGALVLFAVALVLLRTPRRRLAVAGAVVLATAVTALVGLAQLVTTDALLSTWILPELEYIRFTYARLASPWGLASVGSDYGKDVLVGFLVALPLALAPRAGRARWALGAGAVVLAAALLMSGSRSSWLGAVLALAYLVAVDRRLRVAVPALAMACVLAVSVARPQTPVSLQEALGAPASEVREGGVVSFTEKERVFPDARLLIHPDPQDLFRKGRTVRPPGAGGVGPSAPPAVAGVRDALSTETSNNLRRRLIRGGLEMVADRPLFGVGPGAFKQHIDRYEPLRRETGEIDRRPGLSAHNVPLELWADSGTPALLAYLAFFGAVLIGAERARRRLAPGPERSLCAAVTAALGALFVTALFHNYFYDNLLWILAALGTSLALWPAGAQAGRRARR